MEIKATIEMLVQAGLTKDQAALYAALLAKGPQTAREATKAAGVNRTLGYAVLAQLQEIGLVLKADEPGAVAVFSPAHPNTLHERIDAQAQSAERAAIALKSALPDLASAYNLSIGRPGIRFYEGLDGIKEVLEDTLTAKEIIYSYADLDMVEKHIPDINKEYVAKRERLGLKKRALFPDTQENRFVLEGYHVKITDAKLIPTHEHPFKTVMQIYDGKISYFTLGTDTLVGVIITDPNIYEMHKTLFESLWESPTVRSVDA